VEYKLLASLNALNVVQSLIISTGLICGMVVCVRGVAAGELTVGDVVLFVTMLNQLYAPLNFFGTYYRVIQQYMIDLEQLFSLMRTNSAIKVRASPLFLLDGFRNSTVRDDCWHCGVLPASVVFRVPL
jgi:ATP-binding cassette subfamily B (MDR/TAP) protein 6